MADDMVRSYHTRTKHRFEGYAAGPDFLDWDAQPDPFRHFAGCDTIDLPLHAEGPATPFAALATATQIAPATVDLDTLATLLEFSFGLSAWKEFQESRWALRCNPSSGNLHPTEVYALPCNVAGIDDGLYHYRSDQHQLERRCHFSDKPAQAHQGVLIGLGSVQWREAWKYGERAFRYCQLDTGHAMAALRYAAACLGWHVTLLTDWSDTEIAALLGLTRSDDFTDVEPEDAEALLWVSPAGQLPPTHESLLEQTTTGRWQGQANLLDPKPMYRWPVIDEVTAASHSPGERTDQPPQTDTAPLPAGTGSDTAAAIIRRRRSAQQFDPRRTLAQDAFFRMLDALLPRPHTPPWDLWPFAARLHPVLFVHRVEGMRPGLYALPRRPEALAIMQAAMRPQFAWQPVDSAPDHLPLHLLVQADCQRAARTISCKQDIASHSAFSLGMLAEFDTALAEGEWRYRQLYWEAGLIGQTLYLEAEAAGVRGTGIGCFFDDAFHETLGIGDTTLQSLYHFTVGFPLTDTRLQTLPPYAHLARAQSE